MVIVYGTRYYGHADGFLAGGVSVMGHDVLGGVVLLVLAALSAAAFPFWGFVFGRCSPMRRAELLHMLGIQGPPGPGPQAHAMAPQPGMAPPPAGGYGMPAPHMGYGGYGAPPQMGHGGPPPGYRPR